MKQSILESMFEEMQEKYLFKKAHEYAMDYLEEVNDRPIYPAEKALADLSIFEEPVPEKPGNAEEIIDLLHKYGAPASVAQLGGRYYGFVNGSVVPAGIAAKNLTIYWDQNTAMQVISPIAARLESVVQRWMVDLLGLPKGTVAGFVSGTSVANFCALVAARYRILINQGWDINEKGLFDAPKIRVITCTQAHSSIIKAISLAGFGKGNIEWVDVDEQGRIIPELIPELDDQSILILQAGNVNSGAFDPFEQICKKAKEQGAWIHVDGAFGLWAGATQQLKHLTKGYELADSWAVDGHKTLNTPYDSGIVLCKDKEALVSALHSSGAYFVLGNERDGMFYTPEMSKRGRIFELWATLKYLGKTGLDEMIFNMHERAKQFAALLREMEGIAVLNEVVFNQVIVKCATDELTTKLMKGVQEDRVCWVGGSQWKGAKVIRISVCSWATTEKDIKQSASSFEAVFSSVSI